ncbi:MAG TPA: GNAT family N-acetyltransferase [Fimbriimonas sp.]|nr:GNAT family N-acetyltransferase [Fimbriimonas sp.]
MTSIRPATADDCQLVVRFIQELAVYERMRDECVITEEQVQEALFSPKPTAEVVIAEVDGTPAGFALFFTNFSTFVGKPGLYLEDLYVSEEYRRLGIGKALLTHLAKIAVDRDYGRFEWSVLDWNEPAIKFYRSIGAVGMEEWTVQRLAGEALHNLANS